MTLLAEALQRRKSPIDFRQRSLDMVSDDVFEKLYLYEYDVENGESSVWEVEYPLRVLMTHLPINSRWSPDYFLFRLLWAALGGLTAFLLVFAASALTIGPVVAIGPALLFGGIAAAVGYYTGHKATPRPFWTARRLWNKEESEEGPVTILPITHTLLRGEPPLRDPATNGHRPQLQVAGFTVPPQDVYIPRVYRGTTLFEDLKMRTERANMRTPRESWQKIQLGVVGLLAGGLALGLVFVLAVTTE